jgi:hypothetical protein
VGVFSGGYPTAALFVSLFVIVSAAEYWVKGCKRGNSRSWDGWDSLKNYHTRVQRQVNGCELPSCSERAQAYSVPIFLLFSSLLRVDSTTGSDTFFVISLD